MQYYRWFQKLVLNGLPDPELAFYANEALCNLSGYVNSQNNRYRSTENPHAVHEVPLHDLKVGVWSAISAWRINKPVFFHGTINSELYMIMSPFSNLQGDEENCVSILCKTVQ
jgi:hypothetical protein